MLSLDFLSTANTLTMILKSSKLNGVCYDIREPVLDAAVKLEKQGNKILKFNIGNPTLFDFQTSEDIVKDVINNLPQAEGYCDSKGLYSARVARHCCHQSQQSNRLSVLQTNITRNH